MKKALFLALMLAAFLCTDMAAKTDRRIVSRTQNSITFAVDDVPVAPDGLLKYPGDGLAVARAVAGKAYDPKHQADVIACSFASDSLYHAGDNPMFRTFIRCYAEHRPLVLSPDMVWLMITQALSHHLNRNADAMRDRVVAGSGDSAAKETLTIESSCRYDSPEMDWNAAVDAFVGKIGERTKDGFTALKADFSTTGDVERVVSEITLMDAVKPYFEYKMMLVVCGVPSVTLEGTPSDWKKLCKKAAKLSAYDLQWWLDDLLPVLRQFVAASKGRPDIAFWRNMVMTLDPGEVRGPSCSMNPDRPAMTEFDGWFLRFFPFDKEGRTPEKVTMSHKMLAGTVRVPFVFTVSDGQNVIKETDLDLIAGFVGLDQDKETCALRPRMGWVVSTDGGRKKYRK